MMECRRNEFKISIASSRFDKNLHIRKDSFDGFCRYFSEPARTSETLDEFMRMDKIQKDECKDVGGYICGYAVEDNSARTEIIYRSMVTFDLDYAKDSTVGVFKNRFPYKCLIHSTRNHTENNPRYRIIIPLMRDVSIEQYEAVARMIAKEYNILDMLDASTFQACRLMYFPSVSCDSDYVYEVMGEEFLNPDDMLGKYDDWKDITSWPGISESESLVMKKGFVQMNPHKKSGVIGDFCRVFTIQDVIERYLSSVYRPSMVRGRYDYINGSTIAGLVIYDSVFAYSFHATDPAAYRLCNAFDLVRIHLFGYLDDDDMKQDKGRKSFKQMLDFARKEVAVMKEESWIKKLARTDNDQVKNTIQNCVLILRNDSALKAISYEEHSNSLFVKGSDCFPWKTTGVWRDDIDMANLMFYLEKQYGINSRFEQNIRRALLIASFERSYHVLRDYLIGLVWDGEKRVDTLLVDYLGAADDEYTRAVTRKTLVAAVARICVPGIKYDQMLVLSGPQGCGKSTLVARLGGEYYLDSLSFADIKDKTAAEKLQGKWIVEVPELVGLVGSKSPAIRAFLSRSTDDFRPVYEKRVKSFPRECIFIGTTNDASFLVDETGSRRFYPVNVSGEGKFKSWNLTKEIVDQIWAEAYSYYEAGEELTIGEDLVEMAQSACRSAIVQDDREGLVREYLVCKLPDNWEDMNIEERINYLDHYDKEEENSGTVERQYVCNLEIWVECFRKNRADITQKDSRDIRLMLQRIGWEPYNGNSSGKMLFNGYGSQKAYVKSSIM